MLIDFGDWTLTELIVWGGGVFNNRAWSWFRVMNNAAFVYFCFYVAEINSC